MSFSNAFIIYFCSNFFSVFEKSLLTFNVNSTTLCISCEHKHQKKIFKLFRVKNESTALLRERMHAYDIITTKFSLCLGSCMRMRVCLSLFRFMFPLQCKNPPARGRSAKEKSLSTRKKALLVEGGDRHRLQQVPLCAILGV